MNNMNMPSGAQGQVEDVYEEAMNAGHAAAWEQDWQNAIPAYMTAIRARPEDASAHNNLGLALLNAGRLPDALKVYQRAARLSTNDPIPLEKSADVLERLGRLQDAAKQYLAVADIHLANQDMDKAISNWERSTNIAGGLIDVRKKLALAYEKTGRKRQAVREYLTLAYNYKKVGNTPVAIQAVERALRLEPQNPQALNALQALRAGSDIMVPQAEKAPVGRSADTVYEDDFDLPMPVSDDEDAGNANADGPIGEAVEFALEDLATHVMESGAIMEQSGMLIIQAIELHRQESYEEAIRTYKQAQKAGLNHDGIHMNLGALSIADGQWNDAIQFFNHVKKDAYLAGAQHGLGIAYWQLNNANQASRHLISAMQAIEIYMANNDSKIRELTRVYDGLVDGLSVADNKTLGEMNERFFSLLTGVDWKQRIEITRQTLEDAMKKDPTTAIIDVAAVSPKVIDSMNMIDRYLDTRRYHMALEEAYHVLELEPEFLAAHMKIGEVLVQLNRIQQAIDKYNNVAQAYLSRGNKLRASEVLEEIIKAAPMDISVRKNHIEMMEEQEQVDRLLPEYVYLGDAYAELGDMPNAKETYQHAIMLARRLDAPNPVIAEIMHKVVDIDMLRLDMRAASKTSEQIKQLHPTDVKARELLIEINYRLGNPVSAITELDGLLQIHAANRDGKAILQMLQKLVKERPDDEAIRSRLAAIYHQIKQLGPALQHYNHLLELQLNNGRHKEACATIKTILGLNPPQKERYLQLANQLGCN